MLSKIKKITKTVSVIIFILIVTFFLLFLWYKYYALKKSHQRCIRLYSNDIDINTFEYIDNDDNYWGKYCYFDNNTNRINYAKDKNGIYYAGKLIYVSDKDTFVAPWKSEYAKDKYKVYYAGEVIVEADVSSFEVIKDEKNFEAKDKNHKYYRGKIVE